MPSECEASATKPECRSIASRPGRCRSGISDRCRPSPPCRSSARGLRSSSIAASFLTGLAVGEVGLRDDDAVGEDRLLARLRRLVEIAAARSPRRPRVSTTSMANSPPSARSVEKVCRIGLRSARPLVSISTRPKCGILPRSRSATSLRSAFCRSERVLQQRQPLPSSVTSSLLSRSSASSMPTAPNSLTISAVPLPSGVVQETPHQRGLAGAEEAGDDRHRQPRRRARASAAGRTGRRSARETDRGWCRSCDVAASSSLSPACGRGSGRRLPRSERYSLPTASRSTSPAAGR